MSMPPGPDPNEYENALQILTARFLSEDRESQWLEARRRNRNLDRTVWAENQARRLHERMVRDQPFRFTLKSGDGKSGSIMLSQLSKFWRGPSELEGYQNRWRTIKLLRIALNASKITTTEQIQLYNQEYDWVLAEPRLQTILEILGISSAIENPPHLNRDWFGKPGHNWWPGQLSGGAQQLELDVMAAFLDMLERSLGLGNVQDKDFRNADFAPVGARGDNWRDTFSIDWDGQQMKGDGDFHDGSLTLIWDAEDGRGAIKWDLDDVKWTLKLETPLPFRPDFYGAPDDLR